MRLDYRIELDRVEVPRFSVEAVEGIGKLFTLATLVLNVLDTKPRVEVVFHGLNAEDPERRIAAFREIVASVKSAPETLVELREGGRVAGSSSYYRWVALARPS